MATKPDPEPEIILYDLACIEDVCFSPIVWRVRLILNYKRIPYRTVFLEFPDIEGVLRSLGIPPSATPPTYTVPAIHHLPTDTRMMDSLPISHFLESTYPSIPLTLSSDLGTQIQTAARAALGPTFRRCVLPKEVRILRGRSAEYFRRTREVEFGCSLEEMVPKDEVEGGVWDEEALNSVSTLLRTNASSGPYILGAEPSLADFFIVASLQSARVVDAAVWHRIVAVRGFGALYAAVEGKGWLGRRD